MKSIALMLSATALVLTAVLLWQQKSDVQTSERVTREAPLSLWRNAADHSAK